MEPSTFRDAAKQRGLTDKTIDVLLGEDIDAIDLVRDMPAEYFDQLTISVGGKSRLQIWQAELISSGGHPDSASSSGGHPDSDWWSDGQPGSARSSGGHPGSASSCGRHPGSARDKASMGEPELKGYSSIRTPGGLTADLDLRAKQLSDLRKHASEYGVADFERVFDAKLNENLTQPVNIAVAGQSGAGKSSLINTIRSLRPTERGAAAVGTTETTVEITSYEHPMLENVLIWDLPGVGTPKFPKESYVTDVKLHRFDALMICTNARFTESDTWLTKEAIKNNIYFYFLRTKIDIDVANAMDDDGAKEKDTVDDIRAKTKEGMSEQGLPTGQVFLVSSKLKFASKWDFPKLMQELVNNAPPKNQAALIMAMVACSDDLIDKKRKELKERVDAVAIEASNNVDRCNQIIRKEIMAYMDWFGLHREVLDKLDIDIDQLDDDLKDIQGKLDDLKCAPIPCGEAVKALDKSFLKWVPVYNLVGLGVCKVTDAVFDPMAKRDRATDVEKLEKETSIEKSSSVQIAAGSVLRAALDSCVKLARGILQQMETKSLD